MTTGATSLVEMHWVHEHLITVLWLVISTACLFATLVYKVIA